MSDDYQNKNYRSTYNIVEKKIFRETQVLPQESRFPLF